MVQPIDDWLEQRLHYMRDAALQACSFVEGLALEDFMVDPRTNQACALDLIVIGEAAKRILDRCPDFAVAHPQIA